LDSFSSSILAIWDGSDGDHEGSGEKVRTELALLLITEAAELPSREDVLSISSVLFQRSFQAFWNSMPTSHTKR
jgi:hypothetical protein